MILALMSLALGVGTSSQMQRPLAIIISDLMVAAPLVMPALFGVLVQVPGRIRLR